MRIVLEKTKEDSLANKLGSYTHTVGDPEQGFWHCLAAGLNWKLGLSVVPAVTQALQVIVIILLFFHIIAGSSL